MNLPPKDAYFDELTMDTLIQFKSAGFEAHIPKYTSALK
jgi:hypothetical protein